MPTARTNDNIALSYSTNGSGRCHLLFIHDYGGSRKDFQDMMKYFDFTGLRIITYDLRGHGISDKPELGYTVQRFAQDVFDVLDHAGAVRVILIGFGLGAKIAQYAATLQRERVNGLILIGGCPASVMQLPEDIYQNQSNYQFHLTDCRDKNAFQVPKFVWDSVFKMITETSFVSRLELINCPVLVIGGLHDSIFTPDILKTTVVEPLGNPSIVFLDCTHEIPFEKPFELVGLILAFLAGAKAVPTINKIP
ncbi:MAG: alpha/beta hydrolase [Anaerolineae bacterium]|nr:alpha/beta hydrolase [Anaerolineae bacterium]